jgi:hypothetical protein
VSLVQVERVTRAISGLWLRMIAEIGAVPADTRTLLRAERDAFLGWGDAIQKADALADLEKDHADGHTSTFPTCLLHVRAPHACAEVLALGDGAAACLDALVLEHRIDYACLEAPDVAARVEAARAAHAGLGELPILLDWIRAHLTARWRARVAGRRPIGLSAEPSAPTSQLGR